MPPPQLTVEFGDLRIAPTHDNVLRLVDAVQCAAGRVRQRAVWSPHRQATLAEDSRRVHVEFSVFAFDHAGAPSARVRRRWIFTKRFCF